MLLTKANKEAATSLVENDPQGQTSLPEATRQRILNSTVRIYGGAFSASGVIFTLDDNRVTILTAAHNVQIWAKPNNPATNWRDYADRFGKAMNIDYGGNPDQTFNGEAQTTAGKAKTRATAPPAQGDCTDEENCLYDLLVMTSTNGDLMDYARASVFGNMTSDQIAAQLQREATMVINSTAKLLNPRYYYYIQLGYGLIRDERSKKVVDDDGNVKVLRTVAKTCEGGFSITAMHLHYRLTTPNFRELNTFYDQDAGDGEASVYSMYPKAIAVWGKVSSTTAEGDSGGPLYAVDKQDKTKVYLLGVTTGADMEAAKKPCRTIYRNDISASVVPYLKTLYPNV